MHRQGPAFEPEHSKIALKFALPTTEEAKISEEKDWHYFAAVEDAERRLLTF